MGNAQAITAAPARDAASLPERFELCGLLALFGVAIFVQFSIAIAQVLFAVALLSWLGLLITGRERFAAPRWFWPLAGYAVATLISSAFSANPRLSFIDSKQLVLFLIIPVAYRLIQTRHAALLATLVMSVGAMSAALGIFQWGLLHYDQLGQRPQGTLGHYMTYSGLLMMVMGIAIAKLLFGKGERLWAALVMPALAMTVAITLSRNAWVGACAAAAVLMALKDFRLLAALPVIAALTFAVAGPTVNERLFSMFDSKDATRLDRVAMLREGEHMIQAHPLVGVGPDMVKELYAEYRVAGSLDQVNPHLHNVPVQIAAERGLPALVLWCAFIGMLLVDLVRSFRIDAYQVLAAAGIAAVVSMLAGGMFEYNFGDSEFLMLFLLIVTLPSAAARSATSAPLA